MFVLSITQLEFYILISAFEKTKFNSVTLLNLMIQRIYSSEMRYLKMKINTANYFPFSQFYNEIEFTRYFKNQFIYNLNDSFECFYVIYKWSIV